MYISIFPIDRAALKALIFILGNTYANSMIREFRAVSENVYIAAKRVYNYVKKENQEMSLGKSQFVTLLDSKKGYEWCTAQDSIGRQGFYPSHYLKMIERCFSIFVQSTQSIYLSHDILIIYCSKKKI